MASMYSSAKYTLTNDIHPIFRPGNFPGANYEALTPVLRLATRLLTCKASPRHWYTICRGERTDIPYPPGSWGEGYMYDSITPPPRDLTAQETARVQADLLQLAELTSFHRQDVPGTIMGRCRTEEQPIDFGRNKQGWSDDTGWRGWYARSDHGEREYQELWRAHADEACVSFTTEEKMLVRFNIANILLHELAHVGYKSVRGRPIEDMVIGERPVAEAGFDYEHAIYGGHLTFASMASTLTEWPVPFWILKYLRRGNAMFVAEPLETEVEVR